jgi:agmatine deiminase
MMSSQNPAQLGFSMPAEWTPHAATWLVWPQYARDWPGKMNAIQWVYGELVRKIAPGEKVRILVDSPAVEARARRVLETARAAPGQVEFRRWPTNRGWMRDSGPIFVRREKGRPETAIVHFHFNAWARYDDCSTTAACPSGPAGPCSGACSTPAAATGRSCWKAAGST